MLRYVMLILLITPVLIKTEAKAEKIEESLVKQDSIFIRSVIKTYQANPLNVTKLLLPNKVKKFKLGFDYYYVIGSNGKGYVSIFYTMVYFKDRVISYQLDAQLPNDTRLTARYLKMYSPLFKIISNHKLGLVYYNYAEVSNPLKECPIKNAHSTEIDYFMSPYSGIIYGDYGGYAGTILENRLAFENIKSKISPDIFEQLLYSKNPATRLTAIEYYYKHKKMFSSTKGRIEHRIDTIFAAMPIITTMSGCEIMPYDSKLAVKMFANIKETKRP